MSSRHSVGVVTDATHRKPNYVITERQRTKCKKAQDTLVRALQHFDATNTSQHNHLESLIGGAQRVYALMMKERMLAVEAKVKANLVILEQLSQTEAITTENTTPFGLDSVDETLESVVSKDDFESMVEYALTSNCDDAVTGDSLAVEPSTTALDFEEDMTLGNVFILSNEDLVVKFDEEQFLRRFVNTQVHIKIRYPT